MSESAFPGFTPIMFLLLLAARGQEPELALYARASLLRSVKDSKNVSLRREHRQLFPRVLRHLPSPCRYVLDPSAVIQRQENLGLPPAVGGVDKRAAAQGFICLGSGI